MIFLGLLVVAAAVVLLVRRVEVRLVLFSSGLLMAALAGQPLLILDTFGKAMVEAQIDKESDPYFATARLWDDGIIDPRDTRTVIAIALSAAYSAPFTGTTSWGVFRH